MVVYINSDLSYKCRPNLDIFVDGISESTFIEVYTSHSPVIVGIIYSLNIENKNCLLMGDFNCNLNLNQADNLTWLLRLTCYQP